MTDGEKLFITFILALTIPIVFAGVVAMFIEGKLIFFPMAIGLTIYTLVAGLQKNGPLEHSVGIVFGQLTPWTIPTGISWWIPRPLGTSSVKISIETRELDRTKKSNNVLTEVSTRNNTQIEVSYFLQWEVIDVTKAIKVENLNTAFQALIDRGVRWFSREWDADGPYDIAQKKNEFSEYLLGIDQMGPEKKVDGVTPVPLEERPIASGLQDDAGKMGIRILTARIDDINPPKAIVNARESEAVEAAEASKEEKDIESLGKRAAELKNKLGINGEAALHAAQAARGDITVIRVDGSAGDFTKGQAAAEKLRQSPGTSKQKKG